MRTINIYAFTLTTSSPSEAMKLELNYPLKKIICEPKLFARIGS